MDDVHYRCFVGSRCAQMMPAMKTDHKADGLTMKAAILDVHGAAFRVGDVSLPEPANGEVRVRIAASGVNPLDTKIHLGQAAHARHPLPAILGLDLAGTVDAVGAGVTRFRHGDQVYGMTGGVGGVQGSLAEYAVVDADLLAIKPVNITMREAAALPLIFITAWEGLVDRMAVKAGDTVLIQGGAGGVGHIAIQIACARGAKVSATGSARSRSAVEALGATFIDRNEPVEDYVARLTDGGGFDRVYDTAGGVALDASFQAVRRFGHVASCLGWGSHGLAPLSFKGASYSGVFTLMPLLSGIGRRHHGEILTAATSLVEAGKLLPRLDPRRFTLATACDAYRALKAIDGHGKVVVDIADSRSA
jgi:NADPH2:quinone reductase